MATSAQFIADALSECQTSSLIWFFGQFEADTHRGRCQGRVLSSCGSFSAGTVCPPSKGGVMSA